MMKPYFETKLGKLYHGDCLEVMKEFPDNHFDLCLTDPPYKIGAKGCGLAGDRDYLKDITISKMEKGFDCGILDNFKNWFCFCSFRQIPEIINRANTTDTNWMIITWCKTNPTPLVNNNYLPDTEYIIHKYSKGKLYGEYIDKSRYVISPITKNDFDHPTVKPINIIVKLLKLGSLIGNIVVDPFAGSCTTLVACERLGRQWVGIEIEEKYCEMGAQRILAESQQGKLFETI